MSSLLPPNSTLLEHAVANATATAFDLDTDGLRHAESAALTPAQLLPWLAWERSVDDWSDTWPVDIQRRAVALSVPLHKRKGTVWAVKQAIAITGYRAQIQEWWQQTPAGTPHTFAIDVEIDDRGISDGAIGEIERRIDDAKPVRSHYTLRAVGVSRCGQVFTCVSFAGDIVTVQPYQLTDITAPSMQPKAGIGRHDWGTTTIYPYPRTL